MKIAITLLTCGRVDYTKTTLDTLVAQNPNLVNDFILLHGDDVSTPSERLASIDIAEAAGFQSVYVPKAQIGVSGMTEALFVEAAARGADAVLNLQNDWLSLRPIPVDEILEVLEDEQVYCVRMYGAYKSSHGRCGIHHGGRKPLAVVEWMRHQVPGYEVGEIHWGHPPAVTRIKEALKLTAGAKSESDSRMRSGKLTRLTARVINNVFNHIGAERTEGFKA